MAEASDSFRIEQRESLVLMTVGIIAVLLFIATSFAVRLYHAKQKSLADQWFAQGNSAMSARNAATAITDFRNALAFSDSSQYRLQLAEALLAAQRHAEARAYLMNLREDEPADAVVNLDLARMAATDGDVRNAVRFYHDAIYGVWTEQDPMVARRNVRFELANLLLAHGDAQAAQADLVELAANLPKDDAALHTRTAELLLAAGDANTAFAEYRHALDADPQYLQALKGLGSALYSSGDYEQAKAYLERAVQLDSTDEQTRQMLHVSELVLALNPFVHRLSVAERARRAAQDFDLTMNRLRACANRSGADLRDSGESSQASELKATFDRAQQLGRVNERALRGNPDMLYPVMDWIASAQDAATTVCGQPAGSDLAVALITKRQRQ